MNNPEIRVPLVKVHAMPNAFVCHCPFCYRWVGFDNETGVVNHTKPTCERYLSCEVFQNQSTLLFIECYQ